MRRILAIAVFAGLFGSLGLPTESEADEGKKSSPRRGGYSYSQEDTINTYGDSRSNYGSASSLRDPSLDRQTDSGPFDHGFFFDSGVGPRGGDSPYMN